MFGLFEAPQTRLQKRSAKAAQALREQAFRDAVIELQMLNNCQQQALRVHHLLRQHGHDDRGDKMAVAINDAQKTFERTGQFSDAFALEIADLRARARNAADFEAVASFELEGRDAILTVRDQAKANLSTLGVMTIEARELIGELPSRT